jgi:hypothetical protein
MKAHPDCRARAQLESKQSKPQRLSITCMVVDHQGKPAPSLAKLHAYVMLAQSIALKQLIIA